MARQPLILLFLFTMWCAIAVGAELRLDAEDYYARLGLDSSASHNDINKRIREIRMQIHPDVAANKPDLQALLNWGSNRIYEAIGVLESPRRRADYDRKRNGRGQSNQKGNEAQVSVAVLSDSGGQLQQSGIVSAIVKWKEGKTNGEISFSIDTGPLKVPLPNFLNQTTVTVNRPISLEEYQRIQTLINEGTVGVLKKGWIRGETVSATPKLIFDLSSERTRLLVRLNNTSGFEDSSHIVKSPPVIKSPKEQRYAYLPKGTTNPIPVVVVDWTGDNDQIRVVDRRSLRDEKANHFEVGTISRNNLVWHTNQSKYEEIVVADEDKIRCTTSSIVSLPRTGEKQSPAPNDSVLEGVIEARKAFNVPTHRENTILKTCGGVLSVIRNFLWQGQNGH